MPTPRWHIMASLSIVVLAIIGTVSAQERYHRDWSDHPGMPRQILDVDYDARGFLWLVGEEGLHRFDGREVLAKNEPPISGRLDWINRGPNGQLVTLRRDGPAYEIVDDQITQLIGADQAAFVDVEDAAYGPNGTLWLCDGTELFRRPFEGNWERSEIEQLDGQSPIQVRATPDGGALVGTREGRLVRIFADMTSETWHDDPTGQVTRIAVRDEQAQAFTLRFGPNHGIYWIEDGQVRQIYRAIESGRRWTGMTFRGDNLWTVASGEVVAISENGEKVDVLSESNGFRPGGTATVDHEGSLWMASFRGLLQYPEPDVVIWTELDGTREIKSAGDDIYANRWRGPHRLRDDDRWDALQPAGYAIMDWGGVSPWGSAWYVAVKNPVTPENESALLEWDGDRWTEHLVREWGVYTGAYATDEEGVFWIAFFDSLFRVDAPGESPRQVVQLSFDKEPIAGLDVRDGNVRIAFDSVPAFCEAELNASRTGLAQDWACEKIDGVERIPAFNWIDGRPWLATHGRGAIWREGGVWNDLLDDGTVESILARGVNASPKGGVWVVTALSNLRIDIDGTRPRVVERLGPWMGVPDWMNFNVLERSDGTLWIAGMTSPIRVPDHARLRPSDPPPIFVTDFIADGHELLSDRVQELPAATQQIELRWAAPTYRDPGSLHYQVRLDSTEEWVTTQDRAFRFAGLGAGDYRVEVRASVDGERWSPTPADVRFAIRHPLWQRPATWMGVVALAAVVGLGLQWLRERQQVRLERQRTEIAMNLHDELGAGLGSIGLLTDLTADEEMDPAERRAVSARVGEISRDLTRSLSDIVWTLRPASSELSGFALYLRQRASDLFATEETAVEFQLPDPVPTVRLELAVRLEIHAIASEALYNAAKHAGASHVRVTLEPRDSRWTLQVEDDGAGFDPETVSSGMGRENMRARAERIGAQLEVRSAPGDGCALSLTFFPRVEKRG